MPGSDENENGHADTAVDRIMKLAWSSRVYRVSLCTLSQIQHDMSPQMLVLVVRSRRPCEFVTFDSRPG